MATLPQPIKKRYPQNARLGIKSSLSSLKRVVSLVYLLYLANDRKSKIDYSEEYFDGATTKIRLKDAYKAFVSAIFAAGEADGAIAANPLITSQLEPLQVGLELVFQLGKINFVAKKASSAERTGGSRFAKTITFSKNIVFIDVYFSALPEDKRKKVLASWMKNEESGTDADAALYQMLTAFTENLKMSVDDGAVNRTFEQEGLYKELLAGNNVIGKDAHEDVGPLRIYKSFVKEGMHPYVQFQSNEFALKVDNDKLSNYLSLVSTALDLMISEIPEETLVEADPETENNSSQMIYYGCPGSGKSYEVKEIAEGEKGKKIIWYEKPTTEHPEGQKLDHEPNDDEKKNLANNVFRTTFHPDYDYATFVGCYKPVKDDSDKLDYRFIPQVFTNAYVSALRHPDDPTYLIIEEINRGNCAQIFGDLFQLLDRTDGVSDYEIKPDTELAKYLASQGVPSESLKLPANLHLFATMNTSDQSLFPMDSAFKRRWAMEYKPIAYSGTKADNFTITIGKKQYQWIQFLQMVNEMILVATESEDKQMGEFFIKGPVTEKEFINKVMFYLWNDVCKDYYRPLRVQAPYFMRVKNKLDSEKNDFFTFAELFSERNKDFRLLHEFMLYLESKFKEKKSDFVLDVKDV
jgi:hypothetical protein